MKWKLNRLKAIYKGGFFHIFTSNTMVKMIAFVSSFIIVRFVSKQDYAYLTYANNLYSYIGLLSGLGLSMALLKYASSGTDERASKAYLYYALKYGILFQLVMTAILIAYSQLANIPFPQSKWIIVLMALIPALTYISETILCYIRSKQENKLFAKSGFVQAVITLACSVGFVILMGVGGVPLARYLGLVLVLAIFLIPYLKKNVGHVERVTLEPTQKKAFVAMGASLMVANLFSMIMPLNEMFLVNELIRNEVMTANYKVAIQIPSQLPFITSSIMVYYFPIIAKTRENQMILKKSINIQKVTGCILLGICIAGVVLTPAITRLLYGQRYIDTISLSRIFWVVYTINAGFRMIPMNILPMVGLIKFNLILSVLTCVVHFIVDYFSIMLFGLEGVAYATLIVYLVSGIFYWLYIIKKCKSPVNINTI